MAGYRSINEDGIIKDILDIVDTIKNADVDEIFDPSKRSKFASTSIARKTSNLICVFPIMVSSSLTIDTAVMNMKAIERKATIMIQLLFSAYQVQSSEGIDQVLGQFHKNIKLGSKMNIDDVVDVMSHLEESGKVVNVNPAQVKAIQEDMKGIFFYFEENVNPTSLGDFSVSQNKRTRDIVVEANGGKYADAKDRYAMVRDRTSAQKNIVDVAKGTQDLSKNAIINTDYRKANEMVPTMLTINLWYKPDDGSAAIALTNVVVGVKARLIPVASNDIVNHIISKVDDRNVLLQFIRATTRETNFVTDFLLAIDRAKIDALAHSKRGSANPMWKVLERRAMASKLKRLIGSNNNYMAITSLIVSQEDVDYVKKEFNIDVEDPKVVVPLFTNYNLLCFGISDESLEVAKFMFDTGDGNWENYSFTSLEREDKDNTYKKVVNLMTKVAR